MDDGTTVVERPLSWVRLACYDCNRDDKDGITPEELERCAAEGWESVYESQSYEESLAVYDDPADEPPGYSILDWYTHIGYCPDCIAGTAEYVAAMRAKIASEEADRCRTIPMGTGG